MRKSRILTALVALSALVAGCKPPSALSPATGGTTLESPGTVPAGLRRVSSDAMHTLSGVVQMPADRQVQATAADVVNAATLALVDGDGVTLATGVTSNGGTGNETFILSIPTTFSPTLGQVFVLEATKGLSDNQPGNRAVRMRTLLQWTASGWTSISGNGLFAITAMTTAVALISSIDPTHVPGSATMGTVTYSAGNSTFSGAITGYTATDVNSLTQSVVGYLTADNDPVANIARVTPQITGMSSNKGAVGDLVAIFGDGFNPQSGVATVSFNGVKATTYNLRSRTALYVAVPSGATSGAVTVQMPGGASNIVPFTVTGGPTTVSTPQIVGLSRNVVRRGDSITISGANFDRVLELNTINYNGGTATPSVGTTGSLTFTVPVSAVSGPITVTNGNGTSSAFYLGVITSAIQSIVEPFSTVATIDAANTTMTVSSGSVSYVAPYSWSQSGSGPQAGAFGETKSDGTWLNTMVGAYPKGHGVGQIRSNDNVHAQSYGNYIAATLNRGWTAYNCYQGMATNGRIVWNAYSNNPVQAATANLVGNSPDDGAGSGVSSDTYYYQGYPFQDQGTGYLNGTLAGLADSDYFYWVPGGASSITSINVLKMVGHSYYKLPPIPLPAAISTINRWSGYSYGFRLGSNGAHLFLMGGTSNAPYNAYSWSIYELCPSADGYSGMTLVNYGRYSANNSPCDNNNYSVFGVDDRDCWVNTHTSYYYNEIHRLSDGAYITWGYNDYCYNANGWASYVQKIYDGSNDCFYTVRPDQSWQAAKLVNNTQVYNTTQDACTVTTQAINLPAGQSWNSFRMKWSFPYWTWGKVQILKASDNSVLATYQSDPTTDGGTNNQNAYPSKTFDRTYSLLGNAAFNGVTAIKLKAYLNSTYANVTPYLTYWGVTTSYTDPDTRLTSLAYDTGVTGGDVSYQAYLIDQPAGAPAVKVEFSDSFDGTNFGSWTTDITQLSRRYVRYRVRPVSNATGYVGTYLTRMEIQYQN